jgi:hypothetical protein
MTSATVLGLFAQHPTPIDPRTHQALERQYAIAFELCGLGDELGRRNSILGQQRDDFLPLFRVGAEVLVCHVCCGPVVDKAPRNFPQVVFQGR